MAKIGKIIVLTLFFGLLFNCNKKQKDNHEESVIEGEETIYVDESIHPIIEAQVAVFESRYTGKLHINVKPELDIANVLLKEQRSIVVLARDLTKKEKTLFEKRNITPRITKFAKDAIAFVSQKSNNDTLIALENIIKVMQGNKNSGIKGLVFDNQNSSILRYMLDLARTKSIPNEGVYAFKTTEEALEYVAENKGMVAVVGYNWLVQPAPKMKNLVNAITVLDVKAVGGKAYFAPNQNNIAEVVYPLVRDLYIINCQGFSGLGIGFATFASGDIGQRIVLKSGLLPSKMPDREVNVIKSREEIK
jgi:phosphate transport system substrate-binding protein